jgi:hypothetical protein
MHIATLIATILLLATSAPAAPAADTGDAWPLYKKAAERIREGDRLGKSSPAASTLEYNGYPPYSPEWEKMENEAYEHNASALADVHKAIAMKVAHWPHERAGAELSLSYLNELRNIANQVGDAALYDHVHGREASALSRLQDVWHLAELLDRTKDYTTVEALVGIGIRALAMDRMQVIACEIRIAREAPADGNAITAADVQAMIKQLFTNDTDIDARVKAIAANDLALNPGMPMDPKLPAALTKVLRRDRMERNLTAMSLACRLFYFQKNRWPALLEELTTLLPAKPVDHWGAMGYVLIKGGTPKGDRPLVYSRCNAEDGKKLEYPLTEPQFCYYHKIDPDKRIAPGQFRDVVFWSLPKRLTELPVLKPLD